MRNPAFPTDDLARAALLVKCHEAAKDERAGDRAMVSEGAFEELEQVREEFNGILDLYTENMTARDTVQVDDPARASVELDELEQKLLDARRRADRVVRRVCAEVNGALGGETDETHEETYRKYGFMS
jgi:hypothetical protein